MQRVVPGESSAMMVTLSSYSFLKALQWNLLADTDLVVVPGESLAPMASYSLLKALQRNLLVGGVLLALVEKRALVPVRNCH
jgi:hypothetical protein